MERGRCEAFDIYINGTFTDIEGPFDIVERAGAQYTAYVQEYYPITKDQNEKITVKLDPLEGSLGDYRAAINGIEIVKP